jgi:hypothetical protein
MAFRTGILVEILLTGEMAMRSEAGNLMPEEKTRAESSLIGLYGSG